MDEERVKLFNKKAKVNQIRNGIYSFIAYFRNDLNKSTEETRNILQEMGKNIAKTFYNYWKPQNEEPLKIIREIHRVVFKTAAKVREKDNYIIVTNRSCPFCKYKRPVDVAGCELIIGFIIQYFEFLKGKKYVDSISGEELTIPQLQGKVTVSKIFGEKPYCQNVYKKL